MTLVIGLLLIGAAALVWFFMRDRDTAAALAGGLVITAGVVIILPYFAKATVVGSLAVHEMSSPTTDEPADDSDGIAIIP